MNDELSLVLRLFGQADGRYQFVLTVYNLSADRLLVPRPDVIGLRFRPAGSAEEAQWYTRTLQVSRWKGDVLNPSQALDVAFSAVACSARRPPTHEDVIADRFEPWCVELRPGAYDVSYRLSVDDNYFEPNSHYRLSNVRREAESRGARAWTGEAVSNELRVVHW